MDTAPHATGALSAYPPAGRPGVYRVLCAVLISGLLLLSGCRFLHMEPLAITAWSPGEKIVDPAQTTAISIRFSAAMDSTSAEEAFTLTEEDRAVPGRFSWKGRTLSFTPFPGLRENRSYVCAVSTQAEDLQGNSLPQSFRFAFRTGSDTERPRVIGIRPADDFVSVDRMQEIEIEFSEAMDRASLYGAISLSPAHPLRYRWSEDDTHLRLIPAEPLSWQQCYRISVGSEAADRACNCLGSVVSSAFYLGKDRTPPELVYAGNEAESRPFIPEDPGDNSLIVTEGVECWETLKIRFSEPVLRRELHSRISCEPQWRFSLAPSDGDSITELRLIGEERFLYDRRYSLRLARGIPDLQGNDTPEEIVYHFRSNGTGSSPPRVCGLRFYNGESFASLAAYDTLELLPFDSGGYAFFDLSFQLADGATLPLQAAIDHFTITVSNAAAQIHPVRFETEPFEATAPQPPAAAGQTVLRIHVWIKNRAGNGGTITLGLDSAFADSHGNPLPGNWKLSLNT